VKPSVALDLHRKEIRQIIGRYRINGAKIFGSVLHGKDTEESDLDVLIDPRADTTLFDLGGFREDLVELLGVKVDVLTPKALPEKWRSSVLKEAQPI